MTGATLAAYRRWTSGLVILLGMLLVGCDSDQPGREYLVRTDMYTQPSYRHNEDPRPAVRATIPADGAEAPLADSARSALHHNPYVFGPESADSSRVLFETYCSPCHGMTGSGDGPVAGKFQRPPDLTGEKYVVVPDGYIYSVARHGIRIMPPQYENTTGRERWQIVAHIRRLQKQ